MGLDLAYCAREDLGVTDFVLISAFFAAGFFPIFPQKFNYNFFR